MKYFLATYEILDGEHEHSGAVILEAETPEEAYKMADAQEYEPETDSEKFYFSFGGDGMTACKGKSCVEVAVPSQLRSPSLLGRKDQARLPPVYSQRQRWVVLAPFTSALSFLQYGKQASFPCPQQDTGSESRKQGVQFLAIPMIVLREANQIKITDAAQVAAVFRDLLALEDPIARDTEHYYVMHLDVRDTVKLVELVSIGVLDSARVHPRETFRRAIVEGSAGIIVAHNHPSGTVTPSDDDIRATEILHQAGEILGIPLIDHVVFTSDRYYSFRGNAAGVLRE